MMAPVDFDKLFASYLREKRAVSAAKRFISRGMRFSQRPERLSTEDTNRLAFEAIAGWLNSRANRFRGWRGRGKGTRRKIYVSARLALILNTESGPGPRRTHPIPERCVSSRRGDDPDESGVAIG